MASTTRISVKTPVGRMVMGSLYKPNTTDFDNNPLKVKTGPNMGQDRKDYFFALAIPKQGESHWAHTEWGKQIWNIGCTAFPQASQSPTFAWKIKDGDSTVPNKRGKKPVENEGWPGHWILMFSGGFAPKIYKIENGGYVQILEENFVKPGYFLEVGFNADGNGNQNNPGIYLNHSIVCFRAFGDEISFGPNVDEFGFGQSALPAGASLAPPPSSLPLPGPTQTAQQPPPPPVPQADIKPNTAFAQGPDVSSVPPPPPPTPVQSASPSRTMTAKAGTNSYEAFIAGGWSDAKLIAEGFMTI